MMLMVEKGIRRGVDGGFLNCSKLHLNKKSTALLRNIANVLRYIGYASNSDVEFIDTRISGTDEASRLDSLRAVRLQNRKNIFSYINTSSVGNKFGSLRSLTSFQLQKPN